MTILDRYIVRSILGFVFLVMAVVLVLGGLFVFIDQQDDIGVGHYTAIEAMYYTLLNLPQQAFELLLQPAVRLVQLGLPHLERSGNGRIIAITSLAAKEPTQHLALSNMLRPGLTGYLKTLSAELGPQAITVNCVAPGRIDTDRLAHLYPDGPTDEQLADIPLRRWGEPREFGDVVCFLASARAAYVTGTTVLVDGGMSRGLL